MKEAENRKPIAKQQKDELAGSLGLFSLQYFMPGLTDLLSFSILVDQVFDCVVHLASSSPFSVHLLRDEEKEEEDWTEKK